MNKTLIQRMCNYMLTRTADPFPLRDASISQLATKAPNLDRQSAAWALQIQYHTMRTDTLQNGVNARRQEAPEAAEAWFNQQGLSQSMQNHSQSPSLPAQCL